MNIGSIFKRIFLGSSEPERSPTYALLSNERLLELWSERETLRAEAAEALRDEVERRGISPPNVSRDAGPEISEWNAEEVIEQHVSQANSSNPHARNRAHTIQIGERTIDLAHGPFEEIAPFLKIQLFSSRGGRIGPAYVARNSETFVTRELADGLLAVLVFDFEANEVTVSKEEARGWGVPEEELFVIAEANLASQTVQASILRFPGGEEAVMVVGNGSFVSSLALALDGFMNAIGRPNPPAGFLVSVPNWHALLAHPLTSPDPTGAITELSNLIPPLFNYVDAVSDRLYWVRFATLGGQRQSVWTALEGAALPADLQEALRG